MQAAESECYLGLVRHTIEFAYLQELQKLSLKWIATYRSLTESKSLQEEVKSSFQQFRQGFVMQLESLQAENTESFPVPEEMSRHLAVLCKSNKWLLRYENLLLQKQVLLKQIEMLIKDGLALQSDPDVSRAMVDLQ